MPTNLLAQWGSPEPSPLAAAIQQRRDANLPIHDFITANPHDHGFRFSPELLQQILSRAATMPARYSADPLGRPEARAAVASFYPGIPTENILLTPGTSQAYYYLFRLLADTPGANVLCPAPSYPLFDDLATLAGLSVRHYHLQPPGPFSLLKAPTALRWALDPDELRFQITPQTRAIVIVSPHNPTGTIFSAAEMQTACEIANQARVPVILDEVFREYALYPATPRTPQPMEAGADLGFTLNGVSKSHYLPGLKAGWLIMNAPANNPDAHRYFNALEYISDSFLPVSDFVQAALPELLAQPALQEVTRLAALQRRHMHDRTAEAASQGWNVAPPEAGPYLLMPLAEEQLHHKVLANLEEQIALHLLRTYGALFHPGTLYNLPGYLVSTIYNSAPWPVAHSQTMD